MLVSFSTVMSLEFTSAFICLISVGSLVSYGKRGAGVKRHSGCSAKCLLSPAIKLAGLGSDFEWHPKEARRRGARASERTDPRGRAAERSGMTYLVRLDAA